MEPTPSVRFHSLRGKMLAATYGETPQVDGKSLQYDRWPLFGGPFVEAAVDSEQLVLKYGKMRRVLDSEGGQWWISRRAPVLIWEAWEGIFRRPSSPCRPVCLPLWRRRSCLRGQSRAKPTIS